MSVICLIIFGLMQCSINNKLKDIYQGAFLRPVILRGNETNLESLKPLGEEDYKDLNEFKQNHLLEFSILKNIATDITGKLILDGFEYKLHFFDDLSEAERHKIECDPTWGWVDSDKKLYAIFSEFDKEKTDAKNELVISYKDIQGNTYKTIENKLFATCKTK